MDYTDLQLRSKTFLDFTDDPKILDEVLGGHSEDDRNDFLRMFEPNSPFAAEQERIITFMGFAESCKDPKLAEAIRAEFEDDYNAIFKE